MKRILILLTVLSVIILTACTWDDHTVVTTAQPSVAAEVPDSLPPERRLQITATVEEGLGFTSFSPEEIGGGLTESLSYLDLKDVCITVADSVYPLETALQDGLITVEEIFAYARLDARNKLCGEIYETENGLTHFTYCYPEFYVHLVYDVLEAPDGTDHLISDICIYQPGSNIGFFYVDEETGIPLTREDWGLTFEVVDVTATGITVNCTQSGGQQIGQLKTYSYILDSNSEQKCLTVATNEVDIEADATTLYMLDWSDNCGDLPSGAYSLSIEVCDNYDESQMHPLMRNYHDRQWYTISFDIP